MAQLKRSSTTSNSVQPDPERKNKSKIKIDLQLTQSNTSETEGVNNAFNIDEIRNNEPIVTGQIVGNREDTQEVLNIILSGSSTFSKARRVTALVVRAIKNREFKFDFQYQYRYRCFLFRSHFGTGNFKALSYHDR